MHITLKQLNLFIAVAERENLTKGAQAIFLSQPAASITLQELEMQLAEPLFDRVGKKLVLNKNGRKLYPKAIELIDRTKQIENLFKNKNTVLNGTLKIGTSSTIGNYLTPTLIAQFVNLYPEVKIIQKIGNSEEIIEDLEKFNLDIGFIEGVCYSDKLEQQDWGTDELIIFSSPQHPLAKKSEITIKDLENAHWILRESGSGTRETLEKYFHPKHVVLEIGSTQAIKKIVNQTLNLSCASRYALKKELDEKTLMELSVKNLGIKRHFFQLIHQEKYRTDLIKIFLEKFHCILK